MADVIVQENVFRQAGMIKRLRWADRIRLETRRFWSGIGIERGSLDVAATRPEPRAADLVRISLLRHRIRSWWSEASGESCYRDIKAAPEEVHGAALPDEPRAKVFENRID